MAMRSKLGRLIEYNFGLNSGAVYDKLKAANGFMPSAALGSFVD